MQIEQDCPGTARHFASHVPWRLPGAYAVLIAGFALIVLARSAGNAAVAASNLQSLGDFSDGPWLAALLWLVRHCQLPGLLLLCQLATFIVFVGAECLATGHLRDWRFTYRMLTWNMALGVINLMMLWLLFSGAKLPQDQAFLWLSSASFAEGWQPLAEIILLCLKLLLVDGAAYFSHRLIHTIPLLWRFHAVHHAHENLDAVNNCTHPMDQFVQQCWTLVAMRLVCIDTALAIVLSLWATILGSWIHTRAPINWGPLGWLLVDNRSHYEHHRLGARKVGNFGSYLTIWDRLFGTYLKPQSDTLPETGIATIPPAKSFAAFLKGHVAEPG
jgi:sterol desaturase/sphingolipid hydroxylase (fatty acid hydroxylase superfamily)